MLNFGPAPLVVDRWAPVAETIIVQGLDLDAAAIHLQVRLYPDTPGDPLIDMIQTADVGAVGLRVIGVDRAGAFPVSTLDVVFSAAAIVALPAAGALGDDAVFAWDLLVTPSGSFRQRIVSGPFIVRAGVTR